MTGSGSASGRIVILDVGGQTFRTRLDTLQGGSSMLSKMFSGEMEPGLRDEQGHVYIDRDPKHFRKILNCLRCGGAADAAAMLVPAGRSEQRELLLEAQYYGCEDLVAALEEAEERWTRRQAWEDRRLEAAAAINCSRAALLQEADDKQAEAEEALQQSHAELAQLGRQAQQLAAAAAGAAGAELEEHRRAASQLRACFQAAKERGMEAARRRLDSQVLRLAVLGGTDGGGAVLWRQELAKTTQELLRLYQQLESVLRPVLRAGSMPGLLDDLPGLLDADAGMPALEADFDEDLSDSDDEPPQLAAAGRRARPGAARRAQRAAGGAGAARAAAGPRLAALERLERLLLPVGDIVGHLRVGHGVAAEAGRRAGAAGGRGAAPAGGQLPRVARLGGNLQLPAWDELMDDEGPPGLAEDPWVEE